MADKDKPYEERIINVANFPGKLKNKKHGHSGKADQNQEGMTSSETDQKGHASGVIQATTSKEKPRRLVVVGKESTFSREIVDYAIDMAETLSYSIIALNTAPLSCDTMKRFQASRDQVCTDFQMLSEMNAQPFLEEAEKRGIPFTHLVKYSESDEVLAELRKEIGEFEFVVSEEEHDDASDRPQDGNQPKHEIFVYQLL